jgi:hypothetical protein
LPLPTDGYSPGEVAYEVRDDTLGTTLLAIKVDLGEGTWVARSDAEGFIRPHMLAAFADLRTASGHPYVSLFAVTFGARTDNITPTS